MPTQALFFLNDPFVHAKAENYASRLQAARMNDRERIELAWRDVLGREPGAVEREEAVTVSQGISRLAGCPEIGSWRLDRAGRLYSNAFWQQRIHLRGLSETMTNGRIFDQTRRGILRSMVGGSFLLPGIVSQLLGDEAASSRANDPLAPRPPHFPPKAKRVIFLYMSGGVSHIDSWDPKPKLFADAGKTVPVNEFQGRKGNYNMFLKRPQWTFAKHGECGTEVSSLFPHLAECVDDLCVIRSMKSDHTNHYEATLGIHTGSFTFARPSIGSWVSYGLGTLNQNLPSFVVIAPHSPYAGGQVWGSDFLPGSHQGTLVVPGPEPVANIRRRSSSSRVQEIELECMARMNQRHLALRAGDPLLAARIKSFETAFGMQAEMPEVFDLSRESQATLNIYGIERGSTAGFGWQCLIARRLAERGVRFVELIDSGSSNNWDAHGDMLTHNPLAKNVDRAIAGLLLDLKQRGHVR